MGDMSGSDSVAWESISRESRPSSVNPEEVLDSIALAPMNNDKSEGLLSELDVCVRSVSSSPSKSEAWVMSCLLV